MDNEETQSLTPIASDSPWLERCGTLLRPRVILPCSVQRTQICISLQTVNRAFT